MKWIMLSQPLENELTEEGRNKMQKDRRIMMKLAEILLQDCLITAEEKYHLTQLIRKDDDV